MNISQILCCSETIIRNIYINIPLNDTRRNKHRIITTLECGLVMRSVASVCVLYVCPAHALTFESLDSDSSLLVHRHIFRVSIGLIKFGLQRHRVKVKVTGTKNGIYERD